MTKPCRCGRDHERDVTQVSSLLQFTRATYDCHRDVALVCLGWTARMFSFDTVAIALATIVWRVQADALGISTAADVEWVPLGLDATTGDYVDSIDEVACPNCVTAARLVAAIANNDTGTVDALLQAVPSVQQPVVATALLAQSCGDTACRHRRPD